VEQFAAADYPKDAEGAVVAAKLAPGEGRLFRITSDGVAGRRVGGGEYDRTGMRTVVLVLAHDGGPQVVYWNCGPAPAKAVRAK